MIQFRKITKKNYWDVVDLDGGDNKKFIPPNSETLLQAIFNKRLSGAKAIYYDKKIVGLAFFYTYKPVNPFTSVKKITVLANFMIGKQYQGKGYGNKIFPKLLKLIKRTSSTKQIELSVKNPVAIRLYKKNGFTKLKNKKADDFFKKTKQIRMILSF